jgi:hypothetical protein
MKAIFTILTIGSFSYVVYLIINTLNRESPLEKIHIDNFFFEKGSEISVVAQSFENSLRKAGYKWDVVVSPKVSMRAANGDYGGEVANVFAYSIVKAFDVKIWVFENDALIVFVDLESDPSH